MNALAVIPCTCSAEVVVIDRDARREHPERPAEREDRVLALLALDLHLVGRGRLLPRARGERVGGPRRERADREVELDGGVVPPAHAASSREGRVAHGVELPLGVPGETERLEQRLPLPSTSLATSAPTPIIL